MFDHFFEKMSIIFFFERGAIFFCNNGVVRKCMADGAAHQRLAAEIGYRNRAFIFLLEYAAGDLRLDGLAQNRGFARTASMARAFSF